MAIERRRVTDVGVQRALDSQRRAIDLQSAPDAAGAIAAGQSRAATLTDGDVVRIDHTLNRSIQGWFLVDLKFSDTGSATTGRLERVLEDGSDKVNERKQLWLKATGYTSDVEVKVWVF